MAPRNPQLRGAVCVRRPVSWREGKTVARVWPAALLSIGAAGAIAFGVLVDELRADTRSGGRERETQQSVERSTPQSTQYERDDDRSQGSGASQPGTSQQRSEDWGQARSGTSAARSGGGSAHRSIISSRNFTSPAMTCTGRPALV